MNRGPPDTLLNTLMIAVINSPVGVDVVNVSTSYTVERDGSAFGSLRFHLADRSSFEVRIDPCRRSDKEQL